MMTRAMITVVGLTLIVGCGKRKEDDQAIVKALGAEKKAGVDEKALAERKAERLAKEAQAKAAEGEKQAAIDAVTIVPGVEVSDLKKACKAAADAHDGFMNRHFAGEDLEKWEQSKQFQMDMTRKNCLKHGSADIAACQRHALDKAGPELRKEVPMLMMRCIDKFGTQKGGAVPPT